MTFTQIDDFTEYVFALFNGAENHIISSSDAHVPSNCKKHKLELLKSLGLKTDLQKTFRHSFLEVIDRGEVKVEQSSENKLLETEYAFGKHKVKIISQGFNAAPAAISPVSINIDDCEYAVNKRGLNIVVWDIKEERVIDSVCFDTFRDDTLTRKSLEDDLETLCNTYKLICELSAISSDFANRYFKKLSRNKSDAEKIYQFLSKNGLFLAKTEKLISQGISVFAFEQTNVSQLTNPTDAQKLKYVNVDSFGQRPTESFPEKPYNTLHIFGDSIACTWEMADRHTLTNQLQELVKNKYRVINYAVAGCGFENAGSNMLDVEFEPGDVIILLYHKGSYISVKKDLDHMGIPIVNLFPFFNAPHSEEIFFDRHHPNPNGYKIIAKVIYDTISSNVNTEAPFQTHILFTPRNMHKPMPQQEELVAWVKEISVYRPRIGGIVMNCNPFTLGHRYLIEQSASKVDKLFIFVVEEDKSISRLPTG